MKKIWIVSLVLVLAVVISACAPVIHVLGGYTQDEYNVQATKIAEQSMKIDEQSAKISEDADAMQKQTAQISDLTALVSQLKADKAKLSSSVNDYKELICSRTWKDMLNVKVWALSYGNSELAKVEKETQVSFLLTQWVPVGQPDKSSGAWVLVVDYFNGVALNSAQQCVILDPKKWDIAE